MCGFFGGLSSEDNLESKDFINGINKISYRGPDDFGIYIKNSKDNFNSKSNFSLNTFDVKKILSNYQNSSEIFLFKRLSIIDLSKNGHQPYIDESLNHIMCFNGEIYNYVELKKEMKNNGIVFKTDTDTEVLFKGIIKFGINFLNKVNGMFSLVYLNKKNHTVYLARDRFGVKPLYYTYQNKKLIFGSEIKCFCEIKELKNKINFKQLESFIKFEDISNSEETLIENIYQVEPGELVLVDMNYSSFKIKKMNWYNNNYIRKKIDFNYAKEEFLNLITDSVKIRWRSDVKQGVFLSGGLDSSIVSILSSQIESKIHTLSFESSINKYKEHNYVKEVLKKYPNIINKKVNFEIKDYVDNFENITYLQEHPFSNASVITENLLYKEAKKSGFKIMIDGHGADESLLGYDYLKNLYLIECLKTKNYQNILHYILGMILRPNSSKFLNFLRLIKNQLILKKNGFNKKYDTDNFDDFIKSLFFKSNLPKQLLWVDRNSMSSSIENRSPFLDFRLVEFIFTLNYELLINKNTSKYILRESCKKLYPKKLYKREDKIGYSLEEELFKKKLTTDFFNDNCIEAKKDLPNEIFNIIENRNFKNFQKEITMSSIYFWKKNLKINF